jgi:hypothetical protein
MLDRAKGPEIFFIHSLLLLLFLFFKPDTTCRARQCKGPGNFHLSSASCVQLQGSGSSSSGRAVRGGGRAGRGLQVCVLEREGRAGGWKERVYSSESSKMSLPVGVASISTSKKTLCECTHARVSGIGFRGSGSRFRSRQKRHSANARTLTRSQTFARTHTRTNARTHADTQRV